jgi:hypothetical protein
MSRDIFVQDIPPGVRTVADIPDDWTPSPLPFGPDDVIAAVCELASDADFADPGWGKVSLPGAEIEVNLGHDSPLDSFVLQVRASDPAAADAFVAALLRRLDVRAFDPEGAEETGIFGNG